MVIMFNNLSTIYLLCLISLCYALNEFPYLPPLLQFLNGSQIHDADIWHAQRRPEVKQLLEQHILGTWPSVQQRPSLINVTLINSTTFPETTSTSSFYYLTFNTEAGGTAITSIGYEVEILIPSTSNQIVTSIGSNLKEDKDFPLFVTQWNHRSWGLVALSRGYVAMIYPGISLCLSDSLSLSLCLSQGG